MIALVQGERVWSYGRLEARAQALAQALRGLGLTRGSRVGLALGRTPSLVAAMLAVMKAGAAYVPLDPDYPSARLAHMVGDAGLDLILVAASEAAALPEAMRQALAGSGARLVGLDDAAGLAGDEALDPIDRTPVDLVPLELTPEDLAYVIYTSGSTGLPKGVMVPHGALANFLASMAEAPGLSASDTVLALTSLSFDIAALELLLPLSLGARIVRAERAAARDPEAIAALAARHGIDVIQATPSTWRMLASAGALERMQAARRLRRRGAAARPRPQAAGEAP